MNHLKEYRVQKCPVHKEQEIPQEMAGGEVEKLLAQISKLLREGWKPHGSPILLPKSGDEDFVLQAFVKEQ